VRDLVIRAMATDMHHREPADIAPRLAGLCHRGLGRLAARTD
jgi:hypothetical protein